MTKTREAMNVLGRFAAAAGACALAAGAARACPVCMLADPKTSGTYLGMTLMMSALPLGLLGGLIYWLKRRYSPRPPLRAVAPAQPHRTTDTEGKHRKREAVAGVAYERRANAHFRA